MPTGNAFIKRSQLALMLLVVIRQVSEAKVLTPTETFILSLVDEKTEQTTTFLNKFGHHAWLFLSCLFNQIDLQIFIIYSEWENDEDIKLMPKHCTTIIRKLITSLMK